jgi:hypothetical protein
MCGIKPCAKCARKSIGKMAKRKKSSRRRRVGAIRTGEARGVLMNGMYALAGSLIANVVGDAVNKDNKTKYLTGGVQMTAGVLLALTKNRMAQSAGTGMLVTGGVNLLKDAGVKLPGLAGTGTRIAGYPTRIAGGMPNPVAPVPELTQG